MSTKLTSKFIISVCLWALVLFVGLFAQISTSLGGQTVGAYEQEIDIKTGVQDEDGAGTGTVENSADVKSSDSSLPETGEEPTRIIQNFSINIPSINLNKDVIADVDPSDKDEYMEVLNHAVAHGRYTLLPDEATESGNVYLFAHRQGEYQGENIGFFKDLDKIKKGEEAYLDFNGDRYIYKFRSSQVVSPKDTYVYTPYSDTPTLTLQTCEKGQLKRLILTFDYIGKY